MRNKHFFMRDQANCAVDSFMSECPDPDLSADGPVAPEEIFSGTGLTVVVAVLTLLNLLAVVPGT